MGNTLILEESKGRAATTREQLEALQKENNVNLREAILTAAEKAGLETTPDLIASAKLRFLYRDGEVRPLSIYREIRDFMQKHNHGASKIKTITEMVDGRTMKKKRLYDELVHWAEVGNAKRYRLVRSEYAKL